MSPENNALVQSEVRSGVAYLTLDRPPVNVLNISLLEQLITALATLAQDESVRLMVLQAKGKAFSAGVDVADHTPEKVNKMIAYFDRACCALADFPVPTIAAVHGIALGGGCELVLCCDLAVIAADARIGQPEIKLGAIAPIAALRLPYFTGYHTAADLLFTGRVLNADEARTVGLVNAVVPADQVDAWVQSKAGELLSLSRSSLTLAKRALNLGYKSWTNALPQMEKLYLYELMSTADALEGLAAFMEKRQPVWKHK